LQLRTNNASMKTHQWFYISAYVDLNSHVVLDTLVKIVQIKSCVTNHLYEFQKAYY